MSAYKKTIERKRQRERGDNDGGLYYLAGIQYSRHFSNSNRFMKDFVHTYTHARAHKVRHETAAEATIFSWCVTHIV